MLISRFLSGECAREIADDYGITVHEVESALRWGCESSSKRRRLVGANLEEKP